MPIATGDLRTEEFDFNVTELSEGTFLYVAKLARASCATHFFLLARQCPTCPASQLAQILELGAKSKSKINFYSHY